MKICMQKVPILGQNFPKINKRGEHYSGLQSTKNYGKGTENLIYFLLTYPLKENEKSNHCPSL